MPQTKGTVWGTRLGFYLAAIGSAFGLGNLWRFPYVVAENGGGAFVLLYLFLAFVIGMPFLIAELSLGKITRSSVANAMVKVSRDPKYIHSGGGYVVSEFPQWLRWIFSNVGRVSVVLSLFVLAYYAVISGWVLHFLIELVLGVIRGQTLQPEHSLNYLMQNGWLQITLTTIHLTVVAIVVAKGLEQGIERWLGYSVPLFGLLVVILAVRALSLDSSSAALRFLFYPDFSKLKAVSLGQALGHVMFTLSVGFGTMVTFGSYLREKASLPIAGFRVTVLDCAISLAAGLLIFPLAIYGHFQDAGPALLFHAVPQLLTQIPGGQAFGIGFFLCLYLASLGASIGLLETINANFRESRKIKRVTGAWIASAIALLMALIPALSSNVLSDVRFNGHGLLELCDAALINWALPIVALLISQAVAWQLQEALKKAEFTEDQMASGELIYRHWIFTLRYLAPPIVILALVLQFFGALHIL
jgi:neurotransmitter:Na+ symporter, NSS family